MRARQDTSISIAGCSWNGLATTASQFSGLGGFLFSQDAVFRQMSAQSVDARRPLPDQEIADRMEHQHASLILGLDRDESHTTVVA